MKVYIIVLHYANWEDTNACLDSILGQKIHGVRIHTILINNNPELDLSLHLPKKKIPALTLLQNEKNLGFAKAVNQGIKVALQDAEMAYVMLLNNDTVLPPKFMQTLLTQPADITGAVIKFRSQSGAWIYDFGGEIDWDTGRTTHKELTNYPSKSSEDLLLGKPIDYISGCCMMIKRNVLEKVGLLDEKFFFYYEDVDYCVRAKKSGFSLAVNPHAVLYHKLGGSIGRWSRKAILYNLKGNFRFITKHLGWMRPVGYMYLFALTGKIIYNRALQQYA